MLTKPTTLSWWGSNSASLHQTQGASQQTPVDASKQPLADLESGLGVKALTSSNLVSSARVTRDNAAIAVLEHPVIPSPFARDRTRSTAACRRRAIVQPAVAYSRRPQQATSSGISPSSGSAAHPSPV